MTIEEQTEMERRLAALDAALESMKTPDPPSMRQLIMARRSEIRRKISQGHTLSAIRDALATAGLDIKIQTLRDYLYNGEPSTAGRAAKVSRAKKKESNVGPVSRPTASDQKPSFVLPNDATEATAGGLPVRARKMV